MKLNVLGLAAPEMSAQGQPQTTDGLECARSLVGDAGIIV